MVKVIGVRFRNAGKIYYFDPLDMDIEVGQNVIVETARGIEYGHVLIAPREVDNSNVIQPLKAVIRLATPEDDEIEQKNKEKSADSNAEKAGDKPAAKEEEKSEQEAAATKE